MKRLQLDLQVAPTHDTIISSSGHLAVLPGAGVGAERHGRLRSLPSSNRRPLLGWVPTEMAWRTLCRLKKRHLLQPGEIYILRTRADVAELADALDSKSGIRKDVWVRPPPSAPSKIQPRTIAMAATGSPRGEPLGRPSVVLGPDFPVFFRRRGRGRAGRRHPG